MKNRSKKRMFIRKLLESLGQSLPHENIDELINWLKGIQTKRIQEGYRKLELRFEDGGYDNPYDLVIYGYREETDQEFSARMKSVQSEKEREKEAAAKYKAHIEAEAKKLGIV